MCSLLFPPFHNIRTFLTLTSVKDAFILWDGGSSIESRPGGNVSECLCAVVWLCVHLHLRKEVPSM